MRMKILTFITVVSIAAISGFGSASATSPRFYRDDPIVREPEPQDAGGAAPSYLDLMYELSSRPVRVAPAQAGWRARAERQHDR